MPLPTINDLTQIIPAKCSKCAADGKIFPYPKGKGSMWCPNCSPNWLHSFLEHATKTMIQEMTQPDRTRKEKQYAADGIAGLVETRRCRASGTDISIYHNVQAKLDCGCTFMNGRTDHDPEQHNSFSTLCEDHGNLVIHKTLTLARSHMAWPEWCEECQKIMDQKGLFK